MAMQILWVLFWILAAVVFVVAAVFWYAVYIPYTALKKWAREGPQ